MKYKTSFRLTIGFSILYSIACTFGTIFLVTWGSTNWYKELMMVMLSWPLEWNKLIAESLIWLPLNILFWTLLMFFTTMIIEVIVSRFIAIRN